MSFSKAKLKRFNDVDVATCSSPARHVSSIDNSGTATFVGTLSSSSAHPERKEQIEKFFKDAVRFASSSKDSKELATPKEGGLKEDKEKKSKGLRLFRTPSLPHRLRFRQNSDVTATAAANINNNVGSSTTSSTPVQSATTTPVKEIPKSASRLKGKDALHQEIRHKSELIENYLSQIDVLKRHVDQLKETESKLREEHASMQIKTDGLIHELTTVKDLNNQRAVENARLVEHISHLESEICSLREKNSSEIAKLTDINQKLRANNEELEEKNKKQLGNCDLMQSQILILEQEIKEARELLASGADQAKQNLEQIENLKNKNQSLIGDVEKLTKQIEQDALSYAQENKIIQNEMECLKNERNTLKNDLASKCDFIKALQDELLDKNCEIDAHCDTIRQLCREKAQYVEKERLLNTAEEKVRFAEVQAEQKVQKLESDLENALERERAYWRGELEKRQKIAENEIIKIELEKQDVMVLLESTNDMLRERDEKIQKYEDQLRNGIDYYIQLTDNLQKQVVDLKQEMAKTITEKYNYQLTLSNTRSTVNILMERLKKSDADVEQLKAELESLQLAKGALEQSYLTLQAELESLKNQLSESESALQDLRASSEILQKEVSLKENMFNEILTSEEETLAKFTKIASSFQERIEGDAAKYLEMYNELKNKDEKREIYMQDMKKALDEFATVLQFAQLELDNKDNTLMKLQEECEQLKLENISLKSKVDESSVKVATPAKNNSTDIEKIEGLLIDSELRAECDKITNWFLNSTEKCVRKESSSEINELLKPTTPNNKSSRTCTTPVRSSAGKTITTVVSTVNSPRTPKNSTHTPRTTPKKTVLFPGKENIPSPQKQVLKARNV